MPSESKCLAIIPARGGSKGVPLKNIRLLGGKPLIAYTIEAAREATHIDRIICSTEDARIAEIAKSYGCDVPFLRPAALAEDQSKAIGVLQHALESMEALDHTTYDPIVYLEPPAPFRTASDIDRCIELYLSQRPDSVVSVYEANHFHPAYTKKIENGRLKPYCLEEPEGLPRQLYEPKAYLRNGAVYVFTRTNIQEGILYGPEIVPYVMPWDRSLCIDDMIDWYAAEAMLKSKHLSQSEEVQSEAAPS